MVWESSNGGNFWTDEEKKIRLYARQRVAAAQQRRVRQFKRRALWTGLTVIGVALAATVARSASPQNEREKMAESLPKITQTQVVTVAPGDSLWSIARRCSLGDTSTRDTIATIAALNGNIRGELEPGQRLVVPAP
jgi:LysM repeat protein